MILPNDKKRQLAWIRADYIKHFIGLHLDRKSKFFKILYKSQYTSIIVRYKISAFFTKKIFARSVILQRKVCRISGRAHFVIQSAGLARLPFKFLSGCGLLAGVARYGK